MQLIELIEARGIDNVFGVQAASRFALYSTQRLVLADLFVQWAFLKHVCLTAVTSPGTVGRFLTIERVITADCIFCGS